MISLLTKILSKIESFLYIYIALSVNCGLQIYLSTSYELFWYEKISTLVPLFSFLYGYWKNTFI